MCSIGGGGGGAVREVPPSRGLLFRESSARPVLCKPKLLPLQSISLEKLERLQAQQKPPPKNC
ncbi:BBSome interacting protein 1 isoform X1 [Haemaphysalis longicornis]